MKREALDYIWEKFNSCHPFIHEEYKENIVWMYNKKLLRQKKLNRIVGESDLIVDKPSKDSIWYFYQDRKNGYFDINYEQIWLEIESKFGYNYNEINELFVYWLEEHDKMKGLTPIRLKRKNKVVLEEHDKMKGLTPSTNACYYLDWLEDHDKMKGRNLPIFENLLNILES